MDGVLSDRIFLWKQAPDFTLMDFTPRLGDLCCATATHAPPGANKKKKKKIPATKSPSNEKIDCSPINKPP